MARGDRTPLYYNAPFHRRVTGFRSCGRDSLSLGDHKTRSGSSLAGQLTRGGLGESLGGGGTRRLRTQTVQGKYRDPGARPWSLYGKFVTAKIRRPSMSCASASTHCEPNLPGLKKKVFAKTGSWLAASQTIRAPLRSRPEEVSWRFLLPGAVSLAGETWI